MVGRKPVTWSVRAREELNTILRFYRERNGNSAYGTKIQNRIDLLVLYVSRNEEYGQATDRPDIRSVVLKPFELIYKITENKIIIVSIWDARRDPDSLKLP